jgi:hypothetical protein
MIETMMHPVLAEEGAAEAVSGINIVISVMVVLGIVIIAGIMVMGTMGKIARRQSDRPSAREQIEQAKAGASGIGRRLSTSSSSGAGGFARHTPRASAAEIDEVRHLAAMLDNKAERLEQLLVQADDRIARLEQLSQTELKRDSYSNPESAANTDQPTRTAPVQPMDPLTQSVYELADEGYDSVSIAQKLDEQVGKVDLILALRQ